jgi:hypothetical protein
VYDGEDSFIHAVIFRERSFVYTLTKRKTLGAGYLRQAYTMLCRLLGNGHNDTRNLLKELQYSERYKYSPGHMYDRDGLEDAMTNKDRDSEVEEPWDLKYWLPDPAMRALFWKCNNLRRSAVNVIV